ncbi:hypothetical protein Tco_1124025 [Tanacetum coccineum]|uniref:Uncharacterized protein n=1 Tax=Tanacetum coccineum TaxID=301880 RepID=A0ABQ5J6P7_9ASTR
MVSQTRYNMVVDDETRESLRGTIAILIMEEMEKVTDEMRNAIVVDNGTAMVRNQGEDQRQNMQFTRVTKIRFPKYRMKILRVGCTNVVFENYG